MRLTQDQIERFRREGYLAIPDLFTEREIRGMQAELDRLFQGGMLRNVATDGDGKTHSQTKFNYQICPIYHKSTFFRAMPFEPKIIETVTQLIGDPIIEHLDQIFLKPGRSGSPTNWHQDNAYFRIGDPLRGTAMWTAIHDATIANGTIKVIPGSHREVYEHSRDPDSDHHIRCYPPEGKAISLELPAGGVAFFCYGVAHATGPNRTDKARAGLAIHFLHVDYAKPELIEENRTTRPYLTGPKATGGLREYGVKVAGTWQDEIDQALSEK
jgi:ectoine hydroxylase-related dioxygenase (phytanoyl-CoA dioxygenase family)